MRVRGGFRGLLAAFDAGVADELNAREPVDGRDCKRLSPAEVRAITKRDERRQRAREKRKALAERPPY